LSAPKNILLRAQDITVRFGGLTAVDAVSVDIQAGELVGIMGPNGAGKTTFFNAISGVTPLTSGQLAIEGNLWPVTLRTALLRVGWPGPFRHRACLPT
jgi:branched-chain amino acid transport system ATP-binding protein